MKNLYGIMYKQREIVLVPFPYSDLFFAKRRPVLVISNNTYNKSFPDAVVCVITSNLWRDKYSLLLKDADLEVGILPEVSVIKCHKLFTVQQSKILKKFSVLNQLKFGEVLKMSDKLLEQPN